MLLKAIRSPLPIPIEQVPCENIICDTCRVGASPFGCEFTPDGDKCIDRRSIYAESDAENYDRWNDPIARDERERELDRQELILTRKMADNGHLIYYKI